MTNQVESRHNKALRQMKKQRIIDRVQMEFELLPDDRVLISKVYDLPEASQIRIPSFVTDYVTKQNSGVESGAFKDAHYSYIEIDNDPTIDINLSSIFKKIAQSSLKVKITHPERVTSTQSMFEGQKCSSIELINFKLTRCESLKSMFDGCRRLKEIKFNGMTTQNVTDFASMFRRCQSLRVLDLQSFDTSKTTTMRSMFYMCDSLEWLNIQSFRTSNVKTFQKMFYGCERLESIDLSKFDTRKCKKFDHMFQQCEQLSTLDVQMFQTENAESMQDMFCGCRSLVELDCSGFITRKVKDFTSMFRYCTQITTLKIQGFSSESACKAQYMFYDCRNLKELDLGEFSVHEISAYNKHCMFQKCDQLKVIHGNSQIKAMLQ